MQDMLKSLYIYKFIERKQMLFFEDMWYLQKTKTCLYAFIYHEYTVPSVLLLINSGKSSKSAGIISQCILTK
jgi:hypothetical protein